MTAVQTRITDFGEVPLIPGVTHVPVAEVPPASHTAASGASWPDPADRPAIAPTADDIGTDGGSHCRKSEATESSLCPGGYQG